MPSQERTATREARASSYAVIGFSARRCQRLSAAKAASRIASDPASAGTPSRRCGGVPAPADQGLQLGHDLGLAADPAGPQGRQDAQLIERVGGGDDLLDL